MYDRVCSICHAQGKLAAPKLGDKQAWALRLHQNMDDLLKHVIQGYNAMPAKGACYNCSNAEIIAATKYMVAKSNPEADYKLW